MSDCEIPGSLGEAAAVAGPADAAASPTGLGSSSHDLSLASSADDSLYSINSSELDLPVRPVARRSSSVHPVVLSPAAGAAAIPAPMGTAAPEAAREGGSAVPRSAFVRIKPAASPMPIRASIALRSQPSVPFPRPGLASHILLTQEQLRRWVPLRATQADLNTQNTLPFSDEEVAQLEYSTILLRGVAQKLGMAHEYYTQRNAQIGAQLEATKTCYASLVQRRHDNQTAILDLQRQEMTTLDPADRQQIRRTVNDMWSEHANISWQLDAHRRQISLMESRKAAIGIELDWVKEDIDFKRPSFEVARSYAQSVLQANAAAAGRSVEQAPPSLYPWTAPPAQSDANAMQTQESAAASANKIEQQGDATIPSIPPDGFGGGGPSQSVGESAHSDAGVEHQVRCFCAAINPPEPAPPASPDLPPRCESPIPSGHRADFGDHNPIQDETAIEPRTQSFCVSVSFAEAMSQTSPGLRQGGHIQILSVLQDDTDENKPTHEADSPAPMQPVPMPIQESEAGLAASISAAAFCSASSQQSASVPLIPALDIDTQPTATITQMRKCSPQAAAGSCQPDASIASADAEAAGKHMLRAAATLQTAVISEPRKTRSASRREAAALQIELSAAAQIGSNNTHTARDAVVVEPPTKPSRTQTKRQRQADDDAGNDSCPSSSGISKPVKRRRRVQQPAAEIKAPGPAVVTAVGSGSTCSGPTTRSRKRKIADSNENNDGNAAGEADSAKRTFKRTRSGESAAPLAKAMATTPKRGAGRRL
ncbi:hypothetical protein HK105_208547 [Polyrhizophydium stewartii]|uniref:Uncharacterized protein n=1 Tax=Polyrhizophydium stewartii TaxID=2732419 RepID=A0ABR4MXJ9_9FUNG